MSKVEKEISIHKRNELTRGGNPYSLNAQRLANAIYHHIQINGKFEDVPFKIPVQDVIQIMNLGNSKRYIELIKKSLIDLQKPIEIYNPKLLNLYVKNDKQIILWKSIPFLSTVQLVKEGKTTYIEGNLNQDMRVLIAYSNEGNFTPLVLNTYLTKLQSKHSYVLFEYIESYKNDKHRKKKIELGFDRLDKMFNLKGSAKYKYFSKFLPLIERSVEDINNNTDMYLKLAVDKERKQYIIHRIFEFTKKEPSKTVYIKNEISDDEMYAHPNGLFDKQNN